MISNRTDDADKGEELVVEWVARLHKWGVGGAVPFAADILRPMGFLGAQALHFFAPVLTLFTPAASLRRLADLLESPETWKRLSDSFAPPDSNRESD